MICPYRNKMIEAIIEAPHSQYLWGTEYPSESDAYVSAPLGDGKQLVCLTPLATRPNSYALRVDSSWDIEDFGDHVEDCYEAIEEEYGCRDDEWYPDDDEPDEPPEWWGEWPALNCSCGCTWGRYYWPALDGTWQDPYYFVADSEYT